MPIVESSADIRASREALFALTQDYYVRLEWDPFLRDLHFLDGATGPAPGVKVWVQAHNRLAMTVEYITVKPPERVAVKLVRGPFFFESFAGSWIFETVDEEHTRVTFRYSFRTKWKVLRPLLDRAIHRAFTRDIAARTRALKHAAEETDILARIGLAGQP